MSGLVSTYARTRAVIKLTGGEGGDSWGLLGFDGKRPRLPLRLSVRTTETMNDQIVNKVYYILLLDTKSTLESRFCCAKLKIFFIFTQRCYEYFNITLLNMLTTGGSSIIVHDVKSPQTRHYVIKIINLMKWTALRRFSIQCCTCEGRLYFCYNLICQFTGQSKEYTPYISCRFIL